MKKDNLRQKIKDDLLSQLKTRGMEQQFYISLVDDYMTFWDTKESLIKDIEDNGVSTKYDHGGGQRGIKKNDSVAEFYRVSNHMLKLLSELGLRGADVEAEEVYERM